MSSKNSIATKTVAKWTWNLMGSSGYLTYTRNILRMTDLQSILLHSYYNFDLTFTFVSEKRKTSESFYDTISYTKGKLKKKRDNTKPPPIADRLRAIGVATATQMVWLNWFIGSKPSH